MIEWIIAFIIAISVVIAVTLFMSMLFGDFNIIYNTKRTFRFIGELVRGI